MQEKNELKSDQFTECDVDPCMRINQGTKAIDLDFYDQFPSLKVDYTNVTFQWEEDDELPEKPKKKDTSNESKRHKTCDNPRFFLVKVRMNNGQTYTVAKVPFKNSNFIDEEEKELFDYYAKKLHKKHLHVQKPFKYRCLRTSVIDELWIDKACS